MTGARVERMKCGDLGRDLTTGKTDGIKCRNCGNFPLESEGNEVTWELYNRCFRNNYFQMRRIMALHGRIIAKDEQNEMLAGPRRAIN